MTGDEIEELAMSMPTGVLAAVVFLQANPAKGRAIMDRHCGPDELGVALRILETQGLFDFTEEPSDEHTERLMDMLLDLPPVVIGEEGQA